MQTCKKGQKQPSIQSCTELSKTQFFPESIVNIFPRRDKTYSTSLRKPEIPVFQHLVMKKWYCFPVFPAKTQKIALFPANPAIATMFLFKILELNQEKLWKKHLSKALATDDFWNFEEQNFSLVAYSFKNDSHTCKPFLI